MLSEDQKQFFEAFGYLVLRGVFTPEEMAAIKRESDEIFDEEPGVKLPSGRVALQPFFERRPFMSGLVADDRIYSIGEGLLGPDFFLIGTEGNLHAGDTLWHGLGLWDEMVKSVKIAFYPESLDRGHGELAGGAWLASAQQYRPPRSRSDTAAATPSSCRSDSGNRRSPA